MKLSDLVLFIKSANAGAIQVTFDIGFRDRETFEEVVASGAVSPGLIAGIYKVDPCDVAIYPYAPSWTIKVTIPRATRSGGADERDFDGVQQYPPLLDVDIAIQARP